MIYQLNPYLEKTLTNMADRDLTAVLMVPDDEDDLFEQDRLTSNLRLMHDVEVLGLVVDATRIFKPKIDVLKLERDFRVYALTPVGFDLFNSSRQRPTQ